MKPTLAQLIGRRIQTARKSKGWNQTELARQIPKATQAVVSAWERGSREPTAPTLVSLATALGVSADYLLGLEE